MPLSTHTRRQLSYAEGYLVLGMKAEATEALKKIAKEEQDETAVLGARLMLHHEKAEWAKAAKIGSLACEREPGTAGFWIQWAYATRRHVDLQAAQAILLRGLALHPREAVFHFNLACYSAQLGNLDEARTFLETAYHLDTSFAELAKSDEDLAPLREKAE